MLQLLKKEVSLFDNLDNYYQDFLKYSLYGTNHLKQKSLKEIIFSMNQEQLQILESELKNIKEEYLYHSKIHGLYHSQKVLFWVYVLSLDNSLSKVEQKILLDAAKYHDIGRTNDIDDTIHGKVSALKVASIVSNPIYEDSINRNLLYAIIELHSLDDKMEEKIMEKYHLNKNSSFPILWRILKDADALDRIRYDLGYLDEHSFNPVFLRMPTSSFYIKASYELCTYYKKHLKILT